MKNRKIRRILTFVFTFMFVVSTLLGTLPALSLAGNKTDLVEVKNEIYYVNGTSVTYVTPGKVGVEKNVLKGILPYLNDYVAPAGTIDTADKSVSNAEGPILNLTDGSFDSEWAPGGAARPFYNANGDWFVDGSVYNRLAFELKEETNITKIMVAHSATNGLTTGKYKVFVSTEKDTLFNDSNLVADITNTAKLSQNVITTKSGETLKGKYVGFIITKPGYDNTAWNSSKSSYYTRIKEIAVFAADTTSKTPRATVTDLSQTNELPAADSANGEINLTGGRVGKYYSNLMGDGVDKLLAPSEAKLRLLTDGDTSSDVEAKCFTGYEYRFGTTNPSNIFYNDKASVALTYDLGTTFELTKFVLINHGSATMATSHYMIYAANSEDTLFNEDNFVVEVNNNEGKQRNIVTFNEGVTAKYVGVRVYDPSSDYSAEVLANTPTNAYLRLRELAFYGKAVETGMFTATADDVWETDTTLGAANVISGTQPEKILVHRPTGETTAVPDGRLTDGDITTDNGEWRNGTFKFTDGSNVIGNGINIGDYYVDITFNLGGTYKVTGFEVFNSKSSSGGLATRRYQVYASKNSSDLFTAANMIVDYTNDFKAHNAFALASGKTAPEIKYYGIRILDPTCSKDNVDLISPRIRELTLYGERIFNPDDAILMDDKLEFPAYRGTNLAPQAKYDSKFMNPKGVYEKAYSNGNEILTDGLFNNDYRTSSQKFISDDTTKWIGNGIEEGSIYQDLVFDLNFIGNLSGLAVYNHSTDNLTTYKYEIYFANTREDLFKGTPFHKVTNSDAKQRNAFDLNMLNNGSDVTARFVGIRVIDPTTKKPSVVDPSNVYLRLLEIGIFGTLTDQGGDPEPDYNVFNDDEIVLPDWGNNIALGEQPKTFFNKNGESNATGAKGNANLSDGNVRSEFEEQSDFIEVDSKGGLIADHTSFGRGDWSTEILYDFKSEVNVEGFAMIHHGNSALITRHYQIYVSNKKTEIFNTNNMVYEMKNDAANRRNAYNFKGKGEDVKGRYVAIRVLAPTEDPATSTTIYGLTKNDKNEEVTFNNVSTRIMEFAVYGNYTDPDYEYVEPFTPFVTNPEDSYFNDNLLLGKMWDKAFFNSQYSPAHRGKDEGGAIVNGLTTTPYGEEVDPDGNVRKLTHCDFNAWTFTAIDGSQTVDLYWDMRSLYAFNKFAFLSSVSDQVGYYTGWYRLYVTDDLDLLFDDSSIAFEYNALDEEEPDTIYRGVEVNFQKPVVGRYVAIRILSPVYSATSWVRPRIVEVGLWGEQTEYDVTPVNLTEKMPVNAYLGDVKNLKEIDEISLKELNNMSDSKNSTGATIKANGEKLHLVYNLCQDVEMYEIVINSLKGKTALKNYKVYASTTQAGVWSEDALVYTHKGSSAKGNKKFSTAKVARYIRIEILDKADTAYIGDVLVIGPKYKLLRNKNLIKNLTDTSFEIYTLDNKTKDKETIIPESTDSKIAMLHDGSANFTTGLSGAKKGKQTLNLLIDMGDVRNVNSIRLDFPKRIIPYYPTKTYIYFSDTFEEIENVNAKPTYSFESTPTKGYIEKEFMPTTARFVRISFADSGENYGTDEITIGINEITIGGTGIIGMNLNNPNLIDFEDKKLGIKWSIVRASDNDVIENVASSKVVASNATNWQKRSLEKTPYMEIVGGKKYTFKFYDAAGKEVTNLGGRVVEISFKHRDGMDNSTAMIGFAGNKWYIEAYESNSEVYNGYVTTYVENASDNIVFAPLKMISSDDEYWSTIGALEDYGDEKQEYAPTTEEDKTTSTDTIVTEDGDFHIDPQAALRLPIDAQMLVTVTTYTLTPEVYMAVQPLTDPNYIAATYTINLVQGDLDFDFDGEIEVKAKIPDAIKGYFTGYKLIHVKDTGEGEFIDFERKGDYIYFKTRSLSDFALIGEGYTADGSAVLDDSFIGDNSNGSETSPNTGDTSTIYYIIISLISLAAILILNSKNIFKFNIK